MSADLTIQILREIRDGIHATNARLDQTNARLDQTNARLDETNMRMEQGFESLSRRLVDSELRTATALVNLAGSVREVTDLLRSQHDLRPRVQKCEAEIGQLKKRLRPRQV